MRLRIGLLLALALTLAPAASASAAPKFTGTLSGATPKFTWDSSGSGLPAEAPQLRCIGGPFNCDYVLLNVEAAGTLALKLDSKQAREVTGVPLICATSPCASFQDLDGWLYKSDATGAPQGATLTNGDAKKGEPDCVTSFASESCMLRVEPGFYVLEVEFFAALNAPYTGTAELLGVAAPAAAPAEPAPDPQPSEPQPEPQPQPSEPQPEQSQTASSDDKKKAAAKKRRACTKKAKKIKNKRKRAKALKRCKKIR